MLSRQLPAAEYDSLHAGTKPIGLTLEAGVLAALCFGGILARIERVKGANTLQSLHTSVVSSLSKEEISLNFGVLFTVRSTNTMTLIVR